MKRTKLQTKLMHNNNEITIKVVELLHRNDELFRVFGLKLNYNSIIDRVIIPMKDLVEDYPESEEMIWTNIEYVMSQYGMGIREKLLERATKGDKQSHMVLDKTLVRSLKK